MNMKRVFQALLRLYPRDHRQMFAAEMSSVFEAAAEERSRQGWRSYLRFVLAEFLGLAGGAVAAWAAKLGGGRPGPPDEVAEAERRIEALVGRTVHAIAH